MIESKSLYGVLGLLAVLAGCATNELAMFNPYITKDGVQAFRFVGNDTLPSNLRGQDLRQLHEARISNELGKRQYCMRGYEIISVVNTGHNSLVYEGVCKQ